METGKMFFYQVILKQGIIEVFSLEFDTSEFGFHGHLLPATSCSSYET